jgi:hypothetical protein
MAVLVVLVAYQSADAQTIGHVKNVSGDVVVMRGQDTTKAVAGYALEESDIVKTGADGSVGILFVDDTMMSAGPNSEVVLAKFRPEAKADPAFQTDVRKGTLSVISGRIAKKSPTAMTVTTPRSILGVRGTYFLVKVEE